MMNVSDSRRILDRSWPLVAILSWLCLSVSEAVTTTNTDACVSNATHVAWQADCSSSSCACCQWQSLAEAQVEAHDYLRRHIMAFDLAFSETMGFVKEDDAVLPDGLESGMIGPTIQLALQAKREYAYTDALPKHVWQEYVLNYANANEGRSNWRPLLRAKLTSKILKAWQATRRVPAPTQERSLLQSILDDEAGSLPLVDTRNATINDMVYLLNKYMWALLSPSKEDPIVFVSGQTPLIFDPMSVMVYGHASCTGLAILFINSLRSFGIPSRLVGTPAWNQNVTKGNHNWVEVFSDGRWYFLEPTAVKNPTTVDDLMRDPCDRWFCTPERFHSSNNTHYTEPSTKVYAARLEWTSDTESLPYYPMAWERDNRDVPGEDVTDYYQRICSQCQ